MLSILCLHVITCVICDQEKKIKKKKRNTDQPTLIILGPLVETRHLFFFGLRPCVSPGVLLQVLHLFLWVFYFIYNKWAIYTNIDGDPSIKELYIVTFLDRWRGCNRYTWRLQDCVYKISLKIWRTWNFFKFLPQLYDIIPNITAKGKLLQRMSQSESMGGFFILSI